MAALSNFLVTSNDRYAHDCYDHRLRVYSIVQTISSDLWHRRSSCYKMAAPVNTFTAIKERGVVRFLWAKDMATKDIHKEMLPMYGEHCLWRQAVHNWVQKFSEGRTSIEDKYSVDRPVEIATPATLQRVEDIIRGDRRVTIDTVATAIGCSHGQAYNIMHERLGFHKVCSRWVPRQLTPQHKSQRENGLVIAATPALPGRRGRHVFPDRQWWWVLGAPLWAQDEACLHAVETSRVPSAQVV